MSRTMPRAPARSENALRCVIFDEAGKLRVHIKAAAPPPPPPPPDNTVTVRIPSPISMSSESPSPPPPADARAQFPTFALPPSLADDLPGATARTSQRAHPSPSTCSTPSSLSHSSSCDSVHSALSGASTLSGRLERTGDLIRATHAAARRRLEDLNSIDRAATSAVVAEAPPGTAAGASEDGRGVA